MDRLGIHLLIAAPMLVIGVLVAALGRRGLTQHLTTATGPWWVRLWSVHSVMPAIGLVFIIMGVLFVLGRPDAGLGVMFGGMAAGAGAFGVGAVRTARAGNRRGAAFLAVVAVFNLVFFILAALQWRDAAQVLLFAAWAGGLLPFSIAMLARRWRTSDRTKRQSLLLHLTMGVAMSCVAATWLLPAHLRTVALVLLAAGGLCLLVSFALLIIIRRETGRWT